MSATATFDENFYLTNNADVVVAISQGFFSSALQHYNAFGGKELRAPNATFDPNYYAINNPDVLTAVSTGVFSSVFAHYQAFGESENRAPTTAFASFDAAGYLAANADVAAAVTAGTFSSALDHFIAFGQNESRSGSGVTASITPGTTITLTTSAESVTGGAGDDTINGANGTEDTYTVGDIIDGGAGTDTLSLVVDTGGTVPLAAVTNVEKMQIRNTVALDNGGQGSIDLDQFASVTHFVSNSSSQEIELDNVDTRLTLIELNGMTAGESLLIDTGDATTINLKTSGLSGAGPTFSTTEASTAITTVNVEATGNATLADMFFDEATTITFNANGGNITVTDIQEAAAVTTLTTSGSGNVTLNDLNDAAALVTVTHNGTGAASFDVGTALAATVTSVSATSSGAISVTSGANTTAITGGSGDDTIDINALVYNQNAAIDGGAGNDTLSISNATATLFTAAARANISNFEILDVTGAGGNIAVDFDAINTFTSLTAGANGNDVTVSDFVDNGSVTVTGDQDDLVIGVKDATNPGTDNVINLTVNTADNTVTLTELGMEGTETLNIVANDDSDGNLFTISAFSTGTDLETITYSGSADVTFTTTAAATALDTLNAGAATGVVTVTAVAATKNAAITTGSGNDDINGSALVTAGDIIIAGAGNDRITTRGGADTVTTGAGADTVEIITADGSNDVTVVTITDFTAGTGGDQIELTVTDIEASSNVGDLTTGVPTTSLSAEATLGVQELAAGVTTATAGDDIFVLVGATFATTGDVETALETGTHELILGAAPTANDAVLVLYSDGTDAYVASAQTAGTAANLAAGNLTVDNLVKLSGISSIASGDFVDANFQLL